MSQLFHYTFGTDLSEFSSTTVSNGTIEQSAAAGLNSTTGGVLITVTGASVNTYGSVGYILDTLTAFRTAWYTDLSSATIGTSGHSYNIWSPRVGGSAKLGVVTLVNVSGTMSIRLRSFQDTLSEANDTQTLNAADWMEIYGTRESTDGALDGTLRLYLGGGSYAATGELVSELTGLENYNTFMAPTGARIGMSSGSSSVGGSVKIDEIIARDDDTPILFGVGESTIPPHLYFRRRRRRLH